MKSRPMRAETRSLAMTEAHRLSLEHIAEAAGVIDRVFLDTPQFRAESLEPALDGCRLAVKVETMNPIRSFKGRGAEYMTASLAAGRPHLVCASAGNFGQAMAFAARKRGLPITVFTGVSASAIKVERMRAFGADVRLAGEGVDAAYDQATAFAAETGAKLVVDGRDPEIAEGAGTIGIELMRWPEPFDAILVPLGDGALLGGIARWVKAHRPATAMIGVCAKGAPAMERSWRSRRPVFESADTIADGIALTTPFPEALGDLIPLVDDILLVEDATMVTAMRAVYRQLGLVIEPSGAAALAAVMTHRQRFKGQLVATILTGGNLTEQQMREWLAPDRETR